MNRAKLWSAFLLATVTAGTGCGSLPTIDALGYKTAPSAKGLNRSVPRTYAPVATTTATASNGFNFNQGNLLGSVTGDASTSVTVEQENRAVTVVLDEVTDLLRQYEEVYGKLAWNRTTNTFYVSDSNLASGIVPGGTSTAYRQLNNLIIIVDPEATHYSGSIDQFNGIDTIDVGEAGAVAIAQINNVTVIHSGDKGQDADDYVADLRLSLYGPNGSANQLHDWLIYIDARSRPHLYQRKIYKGKANSGRRWNER